MQYCPIIISRSGYYLGAALVIILTSLQPALGQAVSQETRVSETKSQSSNQGRRVSGDGGNDPDTFPSDNKGSDTIIVTGTHIRGAVTAGARVDTITSEQITNSGYGTIHQYLQTYVKNYGGGAGEDTLDTSNQGNFTGASGINLRGLGNSGTLVLVNGRRIAIAGLDTSFSDVSLVPTAAIERVEILSDGGSAIYGTDAVAGVMNILLRTDYAGAETRARAGTVTEGGTQEYMLGQTIGATWDRGSVIISYEYLRREALMAEDRSFTRTQDYRASGGTDNRSFFANPGNILDPLTFVPAFSIPKNQSGRNLDVQQLNAGNINLTSPSAAGTILPRQNRHSVFAYGETGVLDEITLYAEGRFSHKKSKSTRAQNGQFLFVPSSNPFFVNPFGDADFVFLAYDITPDLGPAIFHSKVEDYNGVIGGDITVGREYQIRIYGAAVRQNASERLANALIQDALMEALNDPEPATAFNPFGDGSNTNPNTLSAIRGDLTNRTEATLITANVILDGPVMRLPAGDLKFAIGADYQDIDFDIHQGGTARQAPRGAALGRQIEAVFGELSVPVFDDGSSRYKYGRLDLSLAVRYDHYSDVGGTTNPRVGAKWDISEELSFRANWGRSFRAPNLTDLDESRNLLSTAVVPDPNSPGRMIQVAVISGGNPNLENQKSKNWGVGMTIAPVIADNLKITVDYFNINYKDRIGLMSSPLLAITRPAEFGKFIIRNPTQEQMDEFCRLPFEVFFNRDLCLTPEAVDAIIDNRSQNLLETHVDGVDAALMYGIDINSFNSIILEANGTFIFDFREGASRNSAAQEHVDTLGYPVDFRTRVGVTWSHNDWATATVFTNYTDSYRDKTNSPFMKVRSLLTFDVSLAVTVDDWAPITALNHTTLSVSINNLFDRKPPFVNGILYAYDPNNADPLGRFVSLNLIKRW